jgi:hypothetical protein
MMMSSSPSASPSVYRAMQAPIWHHTIGLRSRSPIMAGSMRRTRSADAFEPSPDPPGWSGGLCGLASGRCCRWRVSTVRDRARRSSGHASPCWGETSGGRVWLIRGSGMSGRSSFGCGNAGSMANTSCSQLSGPMTRYVADARRKARRHATCCGRLPAMRDGKHHRATPGAAAIAARSWAAVTTSASKPPHRSCRQLGFACNAAEFVHFGDPAQPVVPDPAWTGRRTPCRKAAAGARRPQQPRTIGGVHRDRAARQPLPILRARPVMAS